MGSDIIIDAADEVPRVKRAEAAKALAWLSNEAEWMTFAAEGALTAEAASTAEAKPGYYDFVYEGVLAPEASTISPEEPLEVDITAFSFYQLWVNGRFVGRGPAMGHASLLYFDRWSVARSACDGGCLRIAVRLFHEGTATETAQAFEYGAPGVLLAVRSGGHQLAVSGANWVCRPSPEFGPAAQLSQWGNFKEYWHEDRVDAWQQAAVSTEDWSPVAVTGSAQDPERARALRLRETPSLTDHFTEPQGLVAVSPQFGRVELDGEAVVGLDAPVHPQEIRLSPCKPLAAPELTWDFGWVCTGYTELELSGASGVMEIYYGESFDTLRCDVVHFTEGSTHWQSFHRRSCRFLKCRFIRLDGAVQVKQVGLREMRYPFSEDVRLSTGDAFLDEAANVTRRTLAASTSHHYEDCPWREQALWIIDARIMALANAYLHGDSAVTEKSLRQMFALQRGSGAVAATGPKDNAFYFLDFMLHLVPTVLDYYTLTGDKRLVADLLQPIRSLCAFVDGWRNEAGLLDSKDADKQHVGIFFDWSKTLLRKGCTTILNALYVVHLEKLAELLEIFGEPGEAAEVRARVDPLRVAARAAFFCESLGLYRDGCQASSNGAGLSLQANIAAIYAGFEPPESADALLQRVIGDATLARPYGPSFYFFVFEVMHRLGRTDLIYQWMQDYWGEMLRRGATTWWEVFDPTRPDGNYPHPFLGQTPTYEREEVPVSLCHGWSCLPGMAIPHYLFGIDFSEIVNGRILWKANTPALTEYFDYRVQTVAGALHLRFKRAGERYELDVVESPLPLVQI